MAGEYFSGAASATTVYGWGSNDYLCLGVGRNNPVQELKAGRDRGNVMQPAKVGGRAAGWLSGEVGRLRGSEAPLAEQQALHMDVVGACGRDGL